MLLNSDLEPVPIVDIRDGGPVRHAREAVGQARALRDDCLSWFPSVIGPLVPVLDHLARRWLLRSSSPYIAEIDAISVALGFPGVWLLNGCYQWGCTSLAREDNGTPWLARTLDWPFPGLGRHMEIAHMEGSAGTFFNVTWPGYVGVLTGMAPGRFAIAINQAPLWRRTRHPWLRPYDIFANATKTWNVHFSPPDQLLRSVFEQCRGFQDARRLLESTPIARPVIYTLIGCDSGERCVIERTEEAHSTRFDQTIAANDWLHSVESWEGRIGSHQVMTCSFADATANNGRRRDALAGWSGSVARDCFAWVTEPVLNRCTRVAVEMCPAGGVLRVVGFEPQFGASLPQPVTQIGEVSDPCRPAA